MTTSRVLKALRPGVANTNGARPEEHPPGAARDTMHAIDHWEELRRELHRSRRYKHHFVLARIPGKEHAHASIRPALRRAEFYEQEVQTLSSFLRSVDLVWEDGGSIYVLAPECDRVMGEALIARLRKQASEVLPEDGVRLAAFPEDGLTSGALLASLRNRPPVGKPSVLPRAVDAQVGSVVS